ncbi:hypothetical protein [Hymenobacter convexus]|uniref:hypothetical protein n=1 Tax=Hymenobacter sp. CA1UV-4 TaxID=3063782 RepID=UPI0027139298|nr:hypothetical protein [Hymenobacter sp. CA1UV-4]MDO7852323.1 hypothetical protein [Hymenobacter sp. CA1UV-4]
MSSRLQKLIAHYEAEEALLLAERAERLEEWDYGMAHRFTKALAEVYEQLHILNNLADPLHDEKQRAADMLKRLENRSVEEAEYLQQYRQKQLVEARARLAALQAQARPNSAGAKSNHIEETLTMLLHGQIAGFSLVINPQQRLACNLRLVRRTLLITVPEIRRHRAEYRIQKKQLRFLQSLGFRLYDQRDKLLLYTSFAVPEDIVKVKTLLARLVLDGFYYQEMVEHSYISYWETGHGL